MRPRFPNGDAIDYDLQLFEEIVEPIDRRLGSVQALIRRDPEFADMTDIYDVSDHLIGVVLAAAQAYLVTAARYHRIDKSQVLSIGPTHSSGQSIARLVNHGANFWKHADEWDWDVSDPRREAILSAFRAVGIDHADRAPLSCLLIAVVGDPQARLRDLVPLVDAWRAALESAYPDRD